MPRRFAMVAVSTGCELSWGGKAEGGHGAPWPRSRRWAHFTLPENRSPELTLFKPAARSGTCLLSLQNLSLLSCIKHGVREQKRWDGLFPFSSSAQSGRAPRIAHWGRSSSAAARPETLSIRPHPPVGPASDAPGRRALEDARSPPRGNERNDCSAGAGRAGRPPTARKSGLGRSSELTRRPAEARPAPNAEGGPALAGAARPLVEAASLSSIAAASEVFAGLHPLALGPPLYLHILWRENNPLLPCWLCCG